MWAYKEAFPLLCLNISQQNAKIAISTTRPVLNLQTTRPQIEINSQAAKLEISQAKGELEIDNTAYRYSIGIKNLQDMARDNSEEGRQIVIETIGRIAEDGDRMARIESKENVFANMAAEANIKEAPEITWAPIQAPNIRYNLTPAQIDYIPGKLDINLRRGSIDAQLERGTVNISMAQYQSIKFWTTENKYDMTV